MLSAKRNTSCFLGLSLLLTALVGCGDDASEEPTAAAGGGAGGTAGSTAAGSAGAAGKAAGASGSGGSSAGQGGTGQGGAGAAGAGQGGAGQSGAGQGGSAGTSVAGQGGSAGTSLATELPLSISVSDTAKPKIESWPGLDGKTTRPVAGITGPGGKVATFVANELIFTYQSAAERDAFVSKWSGEVLLDIDPSKYGLAELPAMALIRVGTLSVDTSQFIPAARELSPSVSGDHAVSSEDGLKLLTVAVTESAAGQQVSLNWVGEGSDLIDRQISEAASTTSNTIADYDPNPFNWPHLQAGDVQNIGVTEAWRALALEDKLNNRVKIAILDGGFVPDADFPASNDAASVVSWKDATNSTSPNYCGGGSSCDYHGTNVLHVAAARVDNKFGVAGTGGPVAETITVVTLFDMFTSISALLEATARKADIINMSFGFALPTILAPTIAPMNNVTLSLSNKGIALFAGAGNDGDNVDSEECFSICVPFSDKYCWKDCFETYWHFPCENDGVTCVGGLEWRQKTRAANSNYGTEDVRLFAPFTVYVGATPENSATVRVGNGTSYSAPYVSGVAALVKAANPALSGKEIIQILKNTAHGSPDAVVPAYVNALEAVTTALGNVRPELRIVWPEPSLTMSTPGLDGLTLVAASEDYEDGVNAVSITWESDLDGPLGSGHTCNAAFTLPGTRIITATATDSGGKVSKATAKLTLLNQDPTVAITSPKDGEKITVGVPFTATANTWDPEAFGSLPCESVAWKMTDQVSGDTKDLGTGCLITSVISIDHDQMLEATATDGQGFTGTDSLLLSVDPFPASGPPFVTIVQPLTGASLVPQDVAKLVGTAVDPDDPGGSFPLEYTWTGKLNGSTFPIGTGPIVDWKPLDDLGAVCGSKSVELTLTVKDGGGEVTTKKITVSVFYQPC